MGGVAAARRVSCALGWIWIALLLTALPRPAAAVDFLDGSIQVHGYGEMQIRGMSRNFQDNLDLAQWWNIFNLEVEYDVAPDGWGPFSSISAYSRIEVRYDCVWTRACGMFPSANVYGDRALRQPGRLDDARRNGYQAGSIFTGDVRQRAGLTLGELGYQPFNTNDHPQNVGRIFNVDGLDGFFNIAGPDGSITQTADNPAFYTFANYLDYTFNLKKIRGNANGNGTENLGPWAPKDKIVALRALADRVNPFDPLENYPLNGLPGGFDFPYRPSPTALSPNNIAANTHTLPSWEPRGLFLPNPALQNLIRQQGHGLTNFDQNFSQNQLAWNHGASQQETYELKEAYVDLELFDGRLFARLGKQNIVWGKTELFRTTDQFNPQDLGLASLPSLEESRIALFAARFIYSFYEVGPLEDVRLEVAANLDKYQPTDLGRCGEPYAVNPSCDKAFALFAHGLVNVGLAGEVRPPVFYQDVKGVELGSRLEFRWDRFSFALTDFWGYDDFPVLNRLYTYSRNVDPFTGRPRSAQSTQPCDPAGINGGGTAGCLGLQGVDESPPDFTQPLPTENATKTLALLNNSINQSYFHVVCSSSMAFTSLDPTVCAQSVFASHLNLFLSTLPPGIPNLVFTDPRTQNVNPVAAFTLGAALSNLIAGNPNPAVQLVATTLGGAALAGNLVPLHADPNDNFGGGAYRAPALVFQAGGLSLNQVTTDQQKALLGCGPFYKTNCELDGVDLMNMEASAVMQSWPGFEGTGKTFDMFSAAAKPGTTGFVGGPVATRFVKGVGSVILPGAHGPADAGYDPNIDGTSAGLAIPALFGAVNQFSAGQPFRSEMAALSWNFLMTNVALSLPKDPAHPLITEFDKNDPYRSNGCSFRMPQFCANIQAFYAITGAMPRQLRAGGNGQFGRRDFGWDAGGDAFLSYPKRNVLGFSMDFAEDVTKTNWSLEATWFSPMPYADNGQFDGLTNSSTYNVTVSVDRPTFINFLNMNRTFFFNSQWFFQYIPRYNSNFVDNGPLNVLFTATVQTGYFQDRLLPGLTQVFDVNSRSGAILPSVQYRFTENFSTEVGLAIFYGHTQTGNGAINPLATPPVRAGGHAYDSFMDNGLSVVRDRDEVYLRIRYTF